MENIFNKTNLKIAIVCHPTVGGSGIVATELGLKLSVLGNEIHFISYEKPFRLNRKIPDVYFHKVPINEYSLFKYPDYTLPLAATISDVHHKFKLDIVHAHYAVPHATAALLAKDICRHCLNNFPKIITTLHGTDISLLSRDKALSPIIRFSIEKSDQVTAVSEWLKRETYKILKVKKTIEVIYNFYESPKKIPNKLKARLHLGLKPNDFVLVHLSNLRPVKKIEDLLKILNGLKTDKQIKLVIASGGDFSPYESLVNKYNLKNKLQIFNQVINIEEIIAASDLGVFTSESESFGLSILECISLGVPVVTTKVGGISEVVNNNVTGKFFKVGDIKTAVKNILELKANHQHRTELSKNAIEITKQKFNPANILKKYETLYLNSLSNQ